MARRSTALFSDLARTTVALVVALFLSASAIRAQGVLTLELGFSNPGARSLGFGGAFVALADDATAAYANPAGLVQLTRPEVSAEVRHWTYTTPYVQGGRASGEPTGLGIDTVPGLRHGESKADFTGLSFLSYVHPVGRWTLAFYRHQWARFGSSFTTDGLFAEGSTYLDTDRWIDRPGTADLSVVGYNFSAGRRIGERLSLGFGLTLYDVDLELATIAYLPDADTAKAFFSANSYLEERVLWSSTTRSHDTAPALSIGALWTLTRQWSLGGFLRTGFETDTRFMGVPGPAATPETVRQWDLDGNWAFPPAAGLGAAWRSLDGRWTGSFEWDRVGYSVILSGDPDEEIPDGDEIHLGGEYVFLRLRPLVALRLGAWIDPDHRIRATVRDDLFEAILSPGEDVVHYSFGAGIAFSMLQVDFAVDISELRDTWSLSMIYGF